MTIGDRVLVTYTSGKTKEGTLVGETEKQWKVDFDGEEKRVSKKMEIEVIPPHVDESEEKEEEVAEKVLDTGPEEEEAYGVFEEDVEEPTEEEFACSCGEPKTKKGLVVFAVIILAGIAGLILAKLFGVL